MILATRYGPRHVERRFSVPYTNAPMPRAAWAGSSSGELVTLESAVGIGAVGAAIRLVAGVVSSLPLVVYDGYGNDRKPQPRAWQARLFRFPWANGTDFDWRWDIAASLESCENSFLLKHKAGPRVLQLEPVDPELVRCYVDPKTREKVIEIGDYTGYERYTTSEIVHVRGQTVKGGVVGVSRLTQHRDPLGAIQARDRFEGSHWRNGTGSKLAIVFPHGVTKQQADAWRDDFQQAHGGADNAGKAVVVGSGADLKTITGVSLEDQAWAETKRLSLEEVARIMDVPIDVSGTSVEQTATRFLRFSLAYRLRRIERAFASDPDLFGPGSQRHCMFDTSELIEADAITKAEIQHKQIQSGVLLPDEARADMGLPPLPDGQGQIPQIVPVGGAPNPTSEPAPETGEDE